MPIRWSHSSTNHVHFNCAAGITLTFCEKLMVWVDVWDIQICWDCGSIRYRMGSGRRDFRPGERMICLRLDHLPSARAGVANTAHAGLGPARSNRGTPACGVGHERFRIAWDRSEASGRDRIKELRFAELGMSDSDLVQVAVRHPGESPSKILSKDYR